MVRIKEKKRISKVKLFFLIIFFIISIFFNDQDLMYPYYIKISKTAIYLPFFIIIIFILVLINRFHLDVITLLLSIRIGLYLIPLLYMNEVEGYLGNYFSVVASLVAYYIASQNHNEDISRIINRIMMFFMGVVSVQVIIQAVLINVHYGVVSTGLLKRYMSLPIGNSNYIASLILPMMVFIYNGNINTKGKSLVMSLGILALIILQSKNTIIILLFVLIIKYMKSYLNQKNKLKYGVELRSIYVLFLLIQISILTITAYFIVRYILTEWSMGMEYNQSSYYSVFNALTSDRLVVYSREIQRWKENLLWGNGLSYVKGYQRSHNWIIELLVQSGIVGLVVFLSALGVWIRKVKKCIKKNALVKSSFYLISIILVQGLAEVSMFTITFDILFWFIIGLSISEVKRIEKNQLA